MACSCTSSSTVYRPSSNPHGEKSKITVHQTLMGLSASYSPTAVSLSCVHPTRRTKFAFVDGFETCVSYWPQRLHALGTSIGLRIIITVGIGNLIRLEDYYNLCYLYQNLASSRFLYLLVAVIHSCCIGMCLQCSSFFAQGPLRKIQGVWIVRREYLRGFVWGKWVAMEKILWTSTTLWWNWPVARLHLQQWNSQRKPDVSVHVSTYGCLPYTTASRKPGRITEADAWHQNIILLPAPTSQNPGESTDWTWQRNFQHMDQMAGSAATMVTRPRVYSCPNSWVATIVHNNSSWAARLWEHLTGVFCFIPMTFACTSSSTIYKAFSEPNVERIKRMVHYTLNEPPAFYSRITDPLSCTHPTWRTRFAYVGGFKACVFSPLKSLCIGNFHGLRIIVTFVISKHIWLEYYYNFCYVNQNLALS